MGRRAKKKRSSRLRPLVLKIVLVLAVSQAVYLALLRVIEPPLTLTQIGAWVQTKQLERDYVALSDISNHARLAVMAAEDQRFPTHDGFDWHSVRAALQQHQQGRSRLRGASTISQQVAKNVFLWQQRGWIRKGLEAYFTVLLELALDKRRILALYLNVAEMGPGIFGIEAAARHYFGKSARTLTEQEAALIAACLPNPKQYHADKPSRHVRAKASWIVEQTRFLRTQRAVQALLN